MANFGVTWDASAFGRLDAAELIGNWTAEGISTLDVEPDFRYQGTKCISGLVKTAAVGFYCAPGSTNMSATPRVWLCKLNQTNKDAIDGSGLILRIGSSISAYYHYSIFSATTYPIAGGWQVVVIDPNVAQWRTAEGGPSLTAVNYFAIWSDCAATAKAPNLGMDAVDVMNRGTGLTGIGSDTTGSFADFLAVDEGNSSNRWGIVQSRAGIYYVNGVLTIGSSGTPAVFVSNNRVLVFPHHRVTTGFCGLDLNLENATTSITLNNCIFNGGGALYTSDDTRPDYTVTGTSGVLSVIGTTLNVFRQIDFTTGVTATGCIFLNGLRVNAVGASFAGSVFEGCTGAADTAYLGWSTATNPSTKLQDVSFKKGTTATHAIEFSDATLTTINLPGCTFTDYNASNGQNDSALYFTGTARTVTVYCETSPSYKATAGINVTVLTSSRTVKVAVLDVEGEPVTGTNVFLQAASGGPFPYNASVTIVNSSTLATVTHDTHGLATNDKVVIRGASHDANNGVFQITVNTASEYEYTMGSAPGSDPTGTITSTFVFLKGDANQGTDSNELSMSRAITATQPIVGWARKATGTPLYKPGAVAGNVASDANTTFTPVMISDE